VRPPDVKIKYQDSLADYSFSSPITQASQNIEQLEDKLNEIYMGTIGVEFDHILNVHEKEWLYNTFETMKLTPISNDVRVKMAKALIEV
jgi:2-oxoglutarate dehydrogenase complex dehydrogenase (E1) component-like enzyme